MQTGGIGFAGPYPGSGVSTANESVFASGLTLGNRFALTAKSNASTPKHRYRIDFQSIALNFLQTPMSGPLARNT
jgi:hypothetical protein